MNSVTRIILAIVVVVLVGAASFYGGMVFGKGQAQSEVPAGFAGGAAGTGGPGQGMPPSGTPGAGGNRGGMLMGTVDTIGDGQMTITDANGKSTVVKVSDTTLIEKQAAVKLDSLTVGETVVVSGSTGADGTVTARSIQSAPAGRFGGPPGADQGGTAEQGAGQPGADAGGNQ